jgi:hypothetical protein
MAFMDVAPGLKEAVFYLLIMTMARNFIPAPISGAGFSPRKAADLLGSGPHIAFRREIRDCRKTGRFRGSAGFFALLKSLTLFCAHPAPFGP